jgi:hypothetical protein
MGKILFVDLSTGGLKVKIPDEKIYCEFSGGEIATDWRVG